MPGSARAVPFLRHAFFLTTFEELPGLQWPVAAGSPDLALGRKERGSGGSVPKWFGSFGYVSRSRMSILTRLVGRR